tara:strand:- start:418 stop:786 length:369 start_codon:yes stop_codon:yes gene_type:complete
MKIALIETQPIEPTDERPWNAVSVTTPERSAFVTASEDGTSDAEFCLHHLILKVRKLEEDLASAQRISDARAQQRDELSVAYHDLKTHADYLAELVEYSINYQCDNQEYGDRAEKALKEYRS